MISESYKKQGGGYLEHIVCFAHYGNTLMKLKTNSRNAVRRVLYDSPRVADDDRRERVFFMRPIDADALMDEANSDGAYGYVDAKQISDAPTLEVVPVVRCRYCKYRTEHSRNGLTPVLYDSPRAADDDRRERVHMKRYGIWKITLVSVSGEVVICEITARSGKDARKRAESLYEGCQILKMSRVMWLNGFSYAQLSAALMDCVPGYADALLTILADNGVFFCQDEAPVLVD